MNQKKIVGSFVMVWLVWGVGCKPPEGGVEGWVEAQRASAESVCACSSTLGRSVESCLNEFDTAAFEDASVVYDCLYEGLNADPDAEAAFDCAASSTWKLDECASESSCEEDRLGRCLDQHQVRMARCPGVSSVFTEVNNLCITRLEVDRDPVNRLLSALMSQGIRSYAWRECALEGLEPNLIHIRPYAVCFVPYYERYRECESEGGDACERHLIPTASCPSLPPSIVDWLAFCDERH